MIGYQDVYEKYSGKEESSLKVYFLVMSVYRNQSKYILLCSNFILFLCSNQRYTYRVLHTIQMKLILLCVWAEPAVLGSTETALKYKYEI